MQITGTPAAGADAGSPYTATIRATDSAGHVATVTVVIAIAPAPAPPGPGPGPGTGKRWAFVLAMPQPGGAQLAAVAQAQNRTFTVRQPPGSYHEATFDTAGDDPAAMATAGRELGCDLQVLLNGQPLMVGRLGAEADQIDPAGHRFTPVFLDYKEVFRRISLAYGGGPNFADGTDRGDIAWGLLKTGSNPPGPPRYTGVQGYPGANYGVSRGKGFNGVGTGMDGGINYNRQQFAGTEIDNLAQMQPGSFDWDITPYDTDDLRFDVWPGGGRGQDRGVVLAWGGKLVASLTRNIDPSQYADDVFVTGTDSTARTTVEANSDAGTIANIATWSSPAPGVLDVASVDGFGPLGGVPGGDPGGGLTVHASGHTNALLTYTGTAGSTFTGCRYVSGSASGTVSKGNSVTQTPLTSLQVDAAGIATAPQGRWSAVVGTQHTNQGVLAAAAAWYSQFYQVVLPSYSFTLRAGAWDGPDHIWIGDTVRVQVKSGRLQVNDLLPVSEMTFALDADDVDTVTVTAGLPAPSFPRKIRLMDRRLGVLEAR